MADDIDTIAADYFEFRLRTSPTWAHQLARYGYAGAFEDVSRAAEAALMDRFDIAAFHDAVLTSGCVTVPVLDRLVRDWVASADRVP